MTLDFDAEPDRRGSGSVKWERYPADVLPLWVADMDFAVAPCILEAMRQRLAHRVFGYAAASARLREVIVARMQRLYGWAIDASDIVFLPGVVAGFTTAMRTLLSPGDAVGVMLPAYPPMLSTPARLGMRRRDLGLLPEGGAWRIDVEGWRSGMADCRALLLCHPHNPTGMVLDRAALEGIAATCLTHGTLIVSDEIHCDLLFDGRVHVPIASLDPAVARRTITLMGAGKGFNIAGLNTAFAIVQDAGLRTILVAGLAGVADGSNVFGLVATQAAYEAGNAWRQSMLGCLQANRDYLLNAVASRLPGVAIRAPHATFLAWLDCSDASIGGDAQRFFLERGRVALSAGQDFDPAAGACARLNFGCARSVLERALERMQAAVER